MFPSGDIKNKTPLSIMQEGIDNIIQYGEHWDPQIEQMFQFYLLNPAFKAQTLSLLQKLHDYCDNPINTHNPHALCTKGSLYQAGLGCEENLDNAKRLFDSLIEDNYLEALLCRGCIHLNGLGGDINYPEAFRLFDKAKNLGSTRAISKIGYMVGWGLGYESDRFEACRFFQIAVKQSCPEARHHLAAICEFDEDGNQDYDAAFSLYKEAIALNHIPSMVGYAKLRIRLGCDGIHSPYKLLRQAGELGSLEAISALAEVIEYIDFLAMYHHGMLTNQPFQVAQALIADENCITDFLEYDCQKDLNDTIRKGTLIEIIDALSAQATDNKYHVNGILIKCLNCLSRRRNAYPTVISGESNALLEIELLILNRIAYAHLQDNSEANLLFNYIVELYYLLEPETFVEKASQYISAILLRLNSLPGHISQIEETINIALILIKSLLGPNSEIRLSPQPIPFNTLFFLSSLKELVIPPSIEEINYFLGAPLLTEPQIREEARRMRQNHEGNHAQNSTLFFANTCIASKERDLPMDIKHQHSMP